VHLEEASPRPGWLRYVLLGAGVAVVILLVLLVARPRKGAERALTAPDAGPRGALRVPIIPDMFRPPVARPKPDAAPRAAAEPDAAPKPIAVKKPGPRVRPHAVRKPYPKPKPRPIAKPKPRPRPKGRKDDLKKTINPFAE